MLNNMRILLIIKKIKSTINKVSKLRDSIDKQPPFHLHLHHHHQTLPITCGYDIPKSPTSSPSLMRLEPIPSFPSYLALKITFT